MSYFKYKSRIPKKPKKAEKKYGWINADSSLKRMKKIHITKDYDKYMCGHLKESDDWLFNKVTEDMHYALCKKCFSDGIFYPDESLPEELFTI